MLTVTIIALVILILIFIHELGHFIVAKIMGVKVEKFSLGFGRKLFAKTIGGTEYRVSLIPLGGYVKLAGEQLDEKRLPEKWEFFGQKPWRRAAILFAGPFMNFVLAWVIFTFVLCFGSPVYKAVVGGVKLEGPAAIAGLKKGDKILSMNNRKVNNWQEMAEIVYQSPEKLLTFEVKRDGVTMNFEITPRSKEESTPFGEKIETGRIDIFQDSEEVYYERQPFLNALFKGARQTADVTGMIYIGLWRMVTGKISVRHLGGILTIGELTAQAIKLGFIPLAMLLAFISINLAVINLLPIPILDGGHLMFLFVEKIKGRPVSLKVQEVVQSVGLVILISIMLLATYNDIHRYKEKSKEINTGNAEKKTREDGKREMRDGIWE